MKVLVTGGAGFIGSHVCERLLHAGHQVSIVDELNDFYAPELKMQNLEYIESVGAATFYKADICDENAMRRIFDEVRPEIVIHLAARAGVRPSLENPLLYEQVNVRGTLILLELSRLMPVKQFIFASSSSVYGAANRVPFSEEDQVNHPISPYAATKLAGEKMCYTYSYLYGMRMICLRFFTVYGPRQRPDLAIRKFMNMIEHGKAIPVFGNGSSSRDYTFIHDIVDGIVAAMNYDCEYDIFNLGNSSPVELLTLIEILEKTLGKKAQIQWLPEQPGDVPTTYADVQKAKRLLGYSPKVPIADGIGACVSWYRKHVKMNASV